MLMVAAPPCDPPAVWNLRSRWPLQALAETGDVLLVELDDNISIRQAQRSDGSREIVDLVDLPDMDVIVLTRVLADRLVRIIPVLQGKGIAVVVSIDDDFRHTPPMMDSQQKINPARSPLYNWRNMAKAAAVADLVIVSTPALTAYAPHGRCAVIRNCVPEEYLRMPRQSHNKVMVGWAGAAKFHPGDLDVTHGGVAAALDDASEFMVIGEPQGVKHRLGLADHPRATGLVSHELYARHLGSLDVGIAPLTDNAYNASKSAIKCLEYLSRGATFVASPSPEYARLHDELIEAGLEGAGALCAPRARDWRRNTRAAISRAQNAPDGLRAAVASFIEERYTIEGQAWQWAEALKAAHEHRQCLRPKMAPSRSPAIFR